MGSDCHGYLEYRYECKEEDSHKEKYSSWTGIDIGNILYRNYDIFAMLFGVRNDQGYKPLAYNRGLPSDVSSEVQEDEWMNDLKSDAHSHTWVDAKELREFDFDGMIDGGLLMSIIDKPSGKSFVTDAAMDLMKLNKVEREMANIAWVEKDGFRLERFQKLARIALDSHWKLVLDMVKLFAGTYGEINVRLVLWWDC